MGDGSDGRFTANLISLQLQLKTLLDDAGGDGVVRLLDSLCKLSSAEQGIALTLLTGVVNRIASGDIRVTSEEDRAMAVLEEDLYKDIVHSMQEAAGNGPRKLQVVRGGLSPLPDKRPIDLAAARNGRKISFKSILN